ncbi:hypothetical protein [Microbacterium sp. Se63.02b]|uniref:hypothetical protein n=1 Tax=Microbacterium sp. Se63.02b TaxID=2709304 RepID=UPI001FCE9067|nr:hypothetical protein [Microbacterium sp. Se63.02b]
METAREADWALLFTGTPDVYRSSGFASFSMPRTLRGPWTAPAFAAVAGRVERETVGLGSLGALGEVYERSRADRVVLAPVRDDRDWTMAEVRMRGARLYRWVEGSAVRGYAIADTDGGLGRLLECAVLPESDGSAAVYRELYSAVAADWAAAAVGACELAVPALPEEERVIHDVAPHAVRQEDRTGMVRPLRREARLHGIRHFTAGDYF